jgi:NitT/TauT family transport system ATP-binding protein
VFGTGPDAVHALSDIDLQIGRGEFVAVVGPSGCGKSTLLRLLSDLDRPTSGRIEWEHGTAGRTSVAFQEHRLLPWSSVLDNIQLPATMQRAGTATDRERALDLAQLVGLSEFTGVRPAALSGGMKQRASVARALFAEPDLLLLDEPFGALDALTREKITGDTEEIWLKQNFTALLITHSIAEAVHLADRVFVMSARPGRILRTVPIDLPRPRARHVGTDHYNALVNEIRTLLMEGDHD